MNTCPKCNAAESQEIYSNQDGWCGIYACGSEQNCRRGFCQSDKCRIAELTSTVSELLTIISEFDSNPERSLKEKLILLVDELNALRRATNSKGNLISELEAENAELKSLIGYGGLAVLRRCTQCQQAYCDFSVSSEMRCEKCKWNERVAELEAENAKLKSDNTNLRNDLRLLREGLVEALKRASEAEAENAKLVARINELERRLAVWEDQTLRF